VKQQKKHFLLTLIAITLSILFHLLIMFEGPSNWLKNPINTTKNLPKKWQDLSELKKEKKQSIATKISTITKEELSRPKIETFKILHASYNSAKNEKNDDVIEEHIIRDTPKNRNFPPQKESSCNETNDEVKVQPATQEPIAELTEKNKYEDFVEVSDQNNKIENAVKVRKKRAKKSTQAPQNYNKQTFSGLFDKNKFESTLMNLQNEGTLDLSTHNFYGDHRFTTYTNRIGSAIRSSLSSLSVKKKYYQSFVDKFQNEQRKVFLEFVVANDGKIVLVKIIKSSGIAEADKYFEEAIYDISSSIPPFPRWIPYKNIKLKLGFTADPSDHGSETIAFNEIQTY
jgi:hypothetical protein